MKKGIRVLFLILFLLLSVSILASCTNDGGTTGGGAELAAEDTTEPAAEDSAVFKVSTELYDKEMFTVEENGIEFNLGVTISELEAQGLEISGKDVYESEELLIFFDSTGKIEDMSVYEEVNMAGKFNFDLTREDVLELFNIDENEEFVGNDADKLLIFFRDNSSSQYERLIVTEEGSDFLLYNSTEDYLILDIDFWDGAGMFTFNLYYPE